VIRIGVDLGGTKIEAVALGDQNDVIARRRVWTPRDDYAGTVAAMAGIVNRIETDLGQEGTVGVGMPGTISPATGLVKNANSVWLNGRPLAQDLEGALGRPVRLANDANCFALSEASDGAAAGAACVFGVIVGTGTGGGIVVDGRVLVGPHAIAGEWGHNPMPWPLPDEWPGPSCYCGRTGCIETFLSGPGLANDHRRRTGERVSSPEIVRRAGEGEASAEATLQRYEDRMARALAAVINLLDPDVIVLGGGMSNLDRLYESVPRRWDAHVFSDRVDTPLVRARHGDTSGVRGAAWLWGAGGPDVADWRTEDGRAGTARRTELRKESQP
jgi:fructokinase